MLAIMILLLPGLVALRAAASSSSLLVVEGHLETGTTDFAAAWSGSAIYSFGGAGSAGEMDVIQRFDPATGLSSTMSARLSARLSYLSGGWGGDAAYVFGGCAGASKCSGSPIAAIQRYDPANDSIGTVASLPSGRVATSAVWTGSVFYVFGGDSCGPYGNCLVDQIVRFDPATKAVTIMPTTLPNGGLFASSAVWNGSAAYLFGGISGGSVRSTIWKYDPAAGTMAQVASLPQGRYWTSAAYVDGAAYVFGGSSPSGRLDSVARFVPSTNEVSTLTARFPTARYTTAAVNASGVAYVAGGWDGLSSSGRSSASSRRFPRRPSPGRRRAAPTRPTTGARSSPPSVSTSPPPSRTR